MLNERLARRYTVVLLTMLSMLVSACGPTKPDDSSVDRVALVIGNSAYSGASVIPNPVNDARDLSRELRRMNFHVIEGLDLDSKGMVQALKKFESRVQNAKVGLFFYAGHGLQVSGKNHLVPIDASFNQEMVSLNGMLESQTILLDNVIGILNNGPEVSLVLLDACRDNPITSKVKGSGENQRSIKIKRRDKTGEVYSDAFVNRGLAQIEASSASNMLVAFATQPGNVALDGQGDNSPFTSALIKHLPTTGIEVRELLTRVRKDVMAKTDGKQIPWDQSSLTSAFQFVKARRLAPPPP